VALQVGGEFFQQPCLMRTHVQLGSPWGQLVNKGLADIEIRGFLTLMLFTTCNRWERIRAQHACDTVWGTGSTQGLPLLWRATLQGKHDLPQL
jgi:hypothetical protein